MSFNLKIFMSLVATLMIGLLPPALAIADPGDLDTSFGGTGIVITDHSEANTDDRLLQTKVQSDGKIVAGGRIILDANNTKAFLVRYNSNGSLDSTFATQGQFTENFSDANTSSNLSDIAIQSDGKILFSGDAIHNGRREGFVARLDTSGNLDDSFGSNGVKFLSEVSGESQIHAIAIQANGNIMASGQKGLSGPNPTDTLLVQLDTNGTPVLDFGDNGFFIQRLVPSNIFETFRDLAIQRDGKIVLVGQATQAVNPSSGLDTLVARITPEGTLDTSFGNNGIIVHDFGDGLPRPSEFLGQIFVTLDDKILIRGSIDNEIGKSLPFFAQFDTQGNFDPNFANNGFLLLDLTEGEGRTSVAQATLQEDGKILITGGLRPINFSDPLIARFDANGSIDNSFGDQGIVLVTSPSNLDLFLGLSLQADGKIIVVGNSSSDSLIARYEGNSADLLIEKSVDNAAPQVGSQVSYTLKITNNGPDSAGLMTIDELPVGLSFDSASPPQGYCEGTTTITCHLGNLDAFTSLEVSLLVNVEAAGSLTNTATVLGQVIDNNPNNDTASVTINATNSGSGGGSGCRLSVASNPMTQLSLVALLTLCLSGYYILRNKTKNHQ